MTLNIRVLESSDLECRLKQVSSWFEPKYFENNNWV